ncbi:MAG TPA: hypothetical protein VK956_05230, partial [Verrucomicrobium sp.]|nr:hypothetical protein [Verrucomicrobium sp.]
EAYLHPEKAQEKAKPLVNKTPEPTGPASIQVTPPGASEGPGLDPSPVSPVHPSVSVPAGRAGSLPFTSTFANPAAPTLGDAPVRKAEPVPDDMPPEEAPAKPKRTRRNR